MKTRARLAGVPLRLDGSAEPAELLRGLLAIDVRAAAAVGAAIVLLIGLPLAVLLSIWVDEAFTLHTTAAGPFAALTRVIAFEDQPPLYFILEAIWRSWDESSIGFARIPSVLFAAGAVAAIVFAARRIIPGVPPLVVAVVAAMNPVVIWAAVEMRVYSLVLLIGALLLWTFYDGFCAEQPSRAARLWYTAFAVAGLYTQFYVGFLLVAHAATLVILRRSALRGYAVAAAIIALAFAPFVPVAVADAKASSQFVLHPTLLASARKIADVVFSVLLPHDGEWSGLVRIGGSLVAAILLLGLAVGGRPALPRGPVQAAVVQWIAGLAIFSVVFTLAGVPLLAFKYLIVLAPSSLIVGMLFVSSVRRAPRAAGRIALGAYAAFALTTLWGQYRPPFFKPGDWPLVAATVAASGPSIPIAVFPAELAQPLGWYLSAPVIEMPGPMPFSVDYVREMTLPSESAAAAILDPVHARAQRLWVVTTDDCRSSIPGYYDYHCQFLESYLQRRYRVVKTISFHGAMVRLYRTYPDGRTMFGNGAK